MLVMTVRYAFVVCACSAVAVPARGQTDPMSFFALHDRQVEQACAHWLDPTYGKGGTSMANRNACIGGEEEKRNAIMAMWDGIPPAKRKECIAKQDASGLATMSYYYRYLWGCMATWYRPPPEQPKHLQ